MCCKTVTFGVRQVLGDGSAEGPVFVDNSGRRSKLLRRIGLLLGALSLGYAVVLGLAFMGIGVSSTSLLPFAGGGPRGSSNSGPGVTCSTSLVSQIGTPSFW